MFVAEIIFTITEKNDKGKNQFESFVQDFFANLLRNGQILGNEIFWWEKNKLKAVVKIPRPDSLENRYFTKWSKNDWKIIKENFAEKALISILNKENLNCEFPILEREKYLYFFTNAFDDSSPVCAGKSGMAIPLYELPLNQRQKQRLWAWQCSYIEYDKVWLGVDSLEIPMYKQLATHKSELAIEGIKLCRMLENKTGLPTYYYLMRYWGRQKGEKDRLCPSCGNKWRIKKKPRAKGIEKFDFKCNGCRLISHIAANLEGDINASIGEYQN